MNLPRRQEGTKAALTQVQEEMMQSLEGKQEKTGQALEETKSLQEIVWMLVEESEEVAVQSIQELKWTEMKVGHT